MLVFIFSCLFALCFANQIEGARRYSEYQQQSNRIPGHHGDVAYQFNARGQPREQEQVAVQQPRGSAIHPSKKRTSEDFLESEMLAEETQNEAVCQTGFGNCTKCMGLYYISCGFCPFCCYSYWLGFYSCTTCSPRYCIYCRNSLHSENGTCYDYSTSDTIGQGGVAPCQQQNRYPIYCTDSTAQVLNAQSTQAPLILNDVNVSFMDATFQNLNSTVVPLASALSNFAVLTYNGLGNASTMTCNFTYTYTSAPNASQLDYMASLVTTSFSFYYNIQTSRITYGNLSANIGQMQIFIADNAGAQSLVSVFMLALSMAFLLF